MAPESAVPTTFKALEQFLRSNCALRHQMSRLRPQELVGLFAGLCVCFNIVTIKLQISSGLGFKIVMFQHQSLHHVQQPPTLPLASHQSFYKCLFYLFV